MEKHSNKLLNELLNWEITEMAQENKIIQMIRVSLMREDWWSYIKIVLLYQNVWGSCFENSTKLDIYTIFSMEKFQTLVLSKKKILSATSAIELHYTEKPEANGETFTQFPLVIKTVLKMDWKYTKGIIWTIIVEAILKLGKIGSQKML